MGFSVFSLSSTLNIIHVFRQMRAAPSIEGFSGKDDGKI
jgi:hypothetical protein